MARIANTLHPEDVGILFLGVDDQSGAILGVTNTNTNTNTDTKQKDVRKAANACYPPIDTIITRILEGEGRAIVAVLIRGSDERPHFTGRSYE
ncbi:RNA-binding domain-containing protein [Paraburkholderia bannensis]|uniref:RNA-binding domain-containing protein n=1 Tax=Paraburkholderia bannensis TaxID=765414 RepID=UPI002ABD1641|nr:RNA-binding domain-containing protein [Paraburkholderia bannensis]